MKKDLPRVCFCVEHKRYQRKVKTQSNTTEEDVMFDVGSLYAHLQQLKDNRKPRGVRYPLVALLVMIETEVVDPEELEQVVVPCWQAGNSLASRCCKCCEARWTKPRTERIC